jgi:hypothetical protein
MPRQSHDLEKVIPGAAEIVQGAMAKIMEDEISYPSIFQGGFPGPLKFVERLAVKKKYTIGVQSARERRTAWDGWST